MQSFLDQLVFQSTAHLIYAQITKQC